MQSDTQINGINGIAGQITTNTRLNIASTTNTTVPKIRIVILTTAPMIRDNNLSKKLEM